MEPSGAELNTWTDSCLCLVPTLCPRDFQCQLERRHVVLSDRRIVLKRLVRSHGDCITRIVRRLAIDQPLCLELDTRIPSSCICLSETPAITADFRCDRGHSLPVECSLMSSACNDLFPQVASRRSVGRRKWCLSARCNILARFDDEFQEIPSVSSLILASMSCLLDVREVSPPCTAFGLDILLELHDAFVQEVIVPSANVDEEPVA